MKSLASRRALIGHLSALALAACGAKSNGEEIGLRRRGTSSVRPSTAQPLKSVAPVPVGCAVSTQHLADPTYAALLTRQFSQLTPEWEMKMEYIVRDDGTFRFDAPDAIAAFARNHGMRLYGTTLAWYAQHPPAFERMDGDRATFANAYRNYILAVVGRYRGQAAGWDTVNEAVAEDGEGLRDCLWSRNLGTEDYMVRAFEHAAEADPDAVQFINDYNLESLPKKRATFLRLVERLLKRGARVGGIGTQTHIDVDLPPGAMKSSLNELARFGLPIHVSELDVSLGRRFGDFRPRAEKLELQAARVAEVAEAFLDLPPSQRFAFTVWGLRDQDSWLRSLAGGDPNDQPLLFDDHDAAKPAFAALSGAFAKARR